MSNRTSPPPQPNRSCEPCFRCFASAAHSKAQWTLTEGALELRITSYAAPCVRKLSGGDAWVVRFSDNQGASWRRVAEPHPDDNSSYFVALPYLGSRSATFAQDLSAAAQLWWSSDVGHPAGEWDLKLGNASERWPNQLAIEQAYALPPHVVPRSLCLQPWGSVRCASANGPTLRSFADVFATRKHPHPSVATHGGNQADADEAEAGDGDGSRKEASPAGGRYVRARDAASSGAQLEWRPWRRCHRCSPPRVPPRRLLAAEAVRCLGGRRLLLMGDSVMDGTYQDLCVVLGGACQSHPLIRGLHADGMLMAC